MYSYLTLTEQMDTILKLSKSEKKFILENAPILNEMKFMGEKKLVLHFNSKYTDSFTNDNLLCVKHIETVISLATVIIFEIDNATFELLS